MAPAATTTTSAVNSSTAPSRSTTIRSTLRPSGVVVSRVTVAPVTSVTWGWRSAGSTQITCASAFPFTRQG